MKSFLFDLDGTIVDSRLDIAFSVNETLGLLGVRKLPEDVVVSHVGKGVKNLMSRVLPEGYGELDRAVALYTSVYLDHVLERTVLYKGIDEVIRLLARRGALMILITNKPYAHTERIMGHFGLSGSFNAMFGGDTLPALKPHREAFHYLQARYSLVAPETYMVGDSPVDEQFARNSGMPFIFARYGNVIGEDEKASITCDYDAPAVEDLMSMVSGLTDGGGGPDGRARKGDRGSGEAESERKVILP